MREGKITDFQKALKYSLSPLPLAICNIDGTSRKIKKSYLSKFILNHTNEMEQPTIEGTHTIYVYHIVYHTFSESPLVALTSPYKL